MVTNITMKSEDRKLFGVIIRQETKKGFLNVSDLTLAYEKERAVKGWSVKRVNNILASIDNIERIYYILEKQGHLKASKYDPINTRIHVFTEDTEKHGVVKILKQLKVYKTTGRGQNKTVYTDPYVWMLIAMELHPEIYATAVCWLADKLLLNRIEAGNMYKGLTKAVYNFVDVDYKELGKALNYLAFNRNERNIRDRATSLELKALEDIEKYLTTSIEMGHINSFSELINELRRMYNKKWNPIPKLVA